MGSGIVLRNAIKKYGISNFKREIIEECYSKEELNSREIFWIDYYNATKSKIFYNISIGGDGGNTYSGKSEEEMLQISNNKSLAYKGIINQRGNNPNAKKVICFNDMKVFDCCSDAEEYYGLRKESVCVICNKNTKSKTIENPVGGLRLQFEYYEDGKEYIFEEYQRKYTTKSVLCKETSKIYSSVKEAQRILGIKSQYITKCCNGISKSTKGMHFCYV